MTRPGSIAEVVRSGLCISCGACVAAAPPGAVRMAYHERKGMFHPEIVLPGRTDGKGEELDVCPGKGYPIRALSGRFDAPGAQAHPDLGTWQAMWAAQSRDAGILAGASSGGVMTAVAARLIGTGEVEGAVVTGMSFGSSGPRPRTFIARTRKELLEAQGSKYCPVPALETLADVERFPGKLAFVGTPCQVAALRMLQERRPAFREKVPFVVGNFCGGFRDCRETLAIVRRRGFDPAELVRLRYRGEGQPGCMTMEDRSGKVARLPYPGYARMTGYVKHRRCRLCVDATAELADLACGDAWLPRFLSRGEPWSIAVARTRKAAGILQAMAADGSMTLEPVSPDEVRKSQAVNLASKKARQGARRELFRLLGLRLPAFDGGFPSSRGGLLTEARILLSHGGFHAAERAGIYPLLARLLGRTRKEAGT